MQPEPPKTKKKVKVIVRRAKQQLVNWCINAMPSGKSKNDYKLEINLKEKSGDSIEITEYRELTDLEISSLSDDIVIVEITPLEESETSGEELVEASHDKGDISAKSKKKPELTREEYAELQKQYGGLLKKGVEKPVGLDSEAESDSEELTGLDDPHDDPSLKYWGIYTIDLTTDDLKKFVQSKQFSIDMQIPIEAMLPVILFEKFKQDAGWFRQVTGLAQKEAIFLIREIVERTKEADKMILRCDGEPGKTAVIIEQWAGDIESLAHTAAESIGENIAEEIEILVEEYAKTKAAVKEYRKKRYVKCGVRPSLSQERRWLVAPLTSLRRRRWSALGKTWGSSAEKS